MAREFLHGSELKKEAGFIYYACNLFVIGCIMSRDHVFAEKRLFVGTSVGWMLELVSSARRSIKLHAHCQPILNQIWLHVGKNGKTQTTVQK